jgi:hypothetical protein
VKSGATKKKASRVSPRTARVSKPRVVTESSAGVPHVVVKDAPAAVAGTSYWSLAGVSKVRVGSIAVKKEEKDWSWT